MRRLCVGMLLTVTVAGCAAMSVSSHIERNVNFTDYVTYDWGPPDGLPVGDPRLDNNEFFRDYVMGAIEKELAAKGFRQAVGRRTRPDRALSRECQPEGRCV